MPTRPTSPAEAPDNVHTWVGLIDFYDAGGEFFQRCSGSLISPTKFLTAGHCTPRCHLSPHLVRAGRRHALRPGAGCGRFTATFPSTGTVRSLDVVVTTIVTTCGPHRKRALIGLS